MSPSLCVCFLLFQAAVGGALGKTGAVGGDGGRNVEMEEESRGLAMEEFMEEIRRAMSNQWEILQNIRFHTLITKVRVAQLEAQVKKLASEVEETTQASQLLQTGNEEPPCPDEADGGVMLLVEAMKDLSSAYNRLLNSTRVEPGQVAAIGQDFGILKNIVHKMNNVSGTPSAADLLTPTTTLATTTQPDMVSLQGQDDQDGSGPKIFVEYSPNVTVDVGSDAILNCRFSKLANFSVSWARIDSYILTVGRHVLTHDNRFRSDIEGVDHDYRLYIKSVRKKDEGAYECFTNTVPIVSHRIWLTVEGVQDVEEQSILVNYSTNVTAEVGSSATLSCHFNNSSDYYVAWYRDRDMKIMALNTYYSDSRAQAIHDEESGDWMLEIFEVQPSDEGWYMCLLMSPGKLSHRVWLSVVAATPSPSPEADIGVESAGNFFTVRAGDTASLVCRVTDLGDATVSWTRSNGLELLTAGKYGLSPDPRFTAVQREQDWLLQIEQVQKQDAGVYECHVSTLPPTLYTFWLQVEESESLQPETFPGDVRTVQGKDVTLACRVADHPRSIITWTKDGISLASSRHKVMQDGDLVIRAVTLGDSGRYICVASNPEGRAEDSVLLMVEEATRIVRPPRDRVRIRGETVVFRCKAVADGDLQLKVDWLVNGELVNVENELRLERRTNNALVLKWVVEGDSGLYTCRASTQLDAVSASATLTVKAKESDPSPKDKPVAVTTPATAAVDHQCPSSFEAAGNGLCVLQVTNLRYSWLDALEYCRAAGAELASEPGIAALKVFLKERYSPGGDSCTSTDSQLVF